MLTHLPTHRDEEWRYGDLQSLEGLDVSAFERWRDIEVAPGEGHRECIVLEGRGEAWLERLRVKVGAGGHCAIFAVNTAGRYARCEIVVRLAKGAHFSFGGVTVGGAEDTQEFITRIAHDEPEATSRQTVRAVHWGRGTGNFLGRIDVARGSQRTDAVQDFKALLLEKGATANAVPQLEIYADDVKCAHGATVGALDEQAAFYMAARGLPPEVARGLLIRAFIADAFAALEDENERERLLDTALAALGSRI